MAATDIFHGHQELYRDFSGYPSKAKCVTSRVLNLQDMFIITKACQGIFWPDFEKKNMMAAMGVSLMVIKEFTHSEAFSYL